MATIMLVIGTRPEAIKLAPVIGALRRTGTEAIVCLTGQHPDLAREALALFDLSPDIALTSQSTGSLDSFSAGLMIALGAVLDRERPDRVLVQGDTASAFIGALTAHYRGVPIAHVEAGLRSGDLTGPWPEEGNRRMIAQLADIHFAPTASAAAALRAENVSPRSIHITGNTGIDALLAIRQTLGAVNDQRASDRRKILVTCHRRETFGNGIAEIAAALRALAQRSDVAITLPLHSNPEVAMPLREALAGQANIRLVEALDYRAFVAQLASADLVLTDSGGVQEEAPVFGKPVLVLRDTTERTEGIAAGTAKLVGTRASRIVAETCVLLDDRGAYDRMARAHSPYGDGRASERIAAIINPEAEMRQLIGRAAL